MNIQSALMVIVLAGTIGSCKVRGETVKELVAGAFNETNQVQAIERMAKAFHIDQDRTIEGVIWGAYGDPPDRGRAIMLLTKLLELKPDIKEAYLTRGLQKAALKDFDGAIADMTEAIMIEPLYSDAYGFRSEFRREKGDTEGAQRDEKQAAAIRKKGDWKMKELEKRIAESPDDPQLYSLRAHYRDRIEDVKGAEADRQKAAELLKAQQEKQTATEK